MDRAGAASEFASRYASYLDATGRPGTDTPLGLGPAIDEALRHLSVPEAVIPVWQGATPEADQDLRVQLDYRLLGQIVRDLGTTFDISDPEGSLRLNQMRQAAQDDLAAAKEAVLQRFHTLGVVPQAAGASPFVTLNLNIFDDEDLYDGIG